MGCNAWRETHSTGAVSRRRRRYLRCGARGCIFHRLAHRAGSRLGMSRFNASCCGLALLVLALAAGCDSARRDATEVHLTPFQSCPSSPNCVSSDASDEGHYVKPFEISGTEEAAWGAVVAAIRALPRTDIVNSSGDYAHAQCRSRLFGFVDDLEVELRRADKHIAVRSASRTGYSDLGANRRRVEALRVQLQQSGTIR